MDNTKNKLMKQKMIPAALCNQVSVSSKIITQRILLLVNWLLTCAQQKTKQQPL